MAQKGNNFKDRLPEKALLVVYSYHHRNTEKVANVIAKVLDAQIKTPQQVCPEELRDYDLVGFGSGIYDEKHDISLLDLADRLPPAAGGKSFLFSTNGAPASLFDERMSRDQLAKNHRLLKEKLQAKGYVIVGEFSCPGLNTNRFLKHIGGLNKGRPNGEDLKRAEEFARGLKA
ncbi:MAG: flavodoxin [Methanocella sp. PtaU1.Bin125]|nr:MAG: flavodoxin [Methanocella sp. PtaU1.Bin125]